MRRYNSNLTMPVGLKLCDVCVDLAQARGEPLGRIILHQSIQPSEACIDVDLAVVEEAVVLCGRSRLGCRLGRNGPEVIAGSRRSAQRRIRAAVLRLLL